MEHTINITKALADGNRLRVVMALTGYDELCVCQITEILGHTTPTVSRHMSVLQKAGLAKARKEGRWVYYRLSEAFPHGLLKWLKESLADSSEIAQDRVSLKTMMSAGIDDLLKRQKERRACRNGKQIQNTTAVRAVR